MDWPPVACTTKNSNLRHFIAQTGVTAKYHISSVVWLRSLFRKQRHELIDNNGTNKTGTSEDSPGGEVLPYNVPPRDYNSS